MLIRNNKPSVINLAGMLRLNTGLQPVDDALWKEVMEKHLTPALQGMLDEGVIEVVAEEKSDLSAMPERDAVKAVAQTYDMGALETFKANEKRPKVTEALSKQIDEMALPIEKPAKGRK